MTQEVANLYAKIRRLNFSVCCLREQVQALDPDEPLNRSISALTPAAGINIINNADYEQIWNWNGLTTDTGLSLISNSTGVNGTPNILGVGFSGANANAGTTTTSAVFTNNKTGTGSTNIAASFLALSGTNNYAIIVPASGGNVGFGTSTPSATLDLIGTFQYTDTNQAAGKVLTSDASGNATWSAAPSALTVPLSSLLASTAANDINNGAFQQIWRWDGAIASSGISFESNTTAAGSNTAVVNIVAEGAHAASSNVSFGLLIANSHTGTTSYNYGAQISASGGTNNYALVVPSGGGNVGFGTITPNAAAVLDLTSTTKGLLLPRMTKVQRNAISSPVAGLAIYQTDNTPGLRVYNGTNWMKYTEATD